nr:ABC transporter ATP-binding protein [Micromonospora sp. DSM 115978]
MTGSDRAGPVIEAVGVTVRYGQLVAVDGVDLSAAEGEVVGLVGPNGAGKTSLIECLEGLRRPAAGRIRVAGLDPLADRARMATAVGVQLQHSSYPPRTTVDELCRLFAGLYPAPADHRELQEEFDLAAQRGSQVTRLSGGQQQRLALILALIGNPRIVFLDELTSGLDPVARRQVWEGLRRRNDAGLTVLLSSHHMDEVEYLCDRVGVLVAGRLVAMDSVAALVRDHAGAAGRFLVEGAGGDHALRDTLAALGDGVRVTPAGHRLQVNVTDPAQRSRVAETISASGAAARELTASLDDAYLTLTGENAANGR